MMRRLRKSPHPIRLCATRAGGSTSPRGGGGFEVCARATTCDGPARLGEETFCAPFICDCTVRQRVRSVRARNNKSTQENRAVEIGRLTRSFCAKRYMLLA